MKKRLCFLLLLLITLSFLIPTVSGAELEPKMKPVDPNYEIVVPMVEATEKVHDLAGLFTEDERDILRAKSQKYQEMLSMDCVFVTTNDAKGLSAMEYADDFYDYNGFGLSEGSKVGDQRNGILILIDMDNRDVWITTTGMGITVYSDASIETILDAAFEHMPDGRYFNAMVAAVDKSLEIGLNEYQRAAQSTTGQQQIKDGIDSSYDISAIDDRIQQNKGPLFSLNARILAIALIPAGILALVVIAVMVASHNKSLGTPPLATKQYLSDSGIRHRGQVDLLINTRTSRRKLPESTSSSSGGGGFGGGGGSHSSSSGSSHGGGGRGF